MWILETVGNLGYTFTNAHSKLVMEIEGGIDADGVGIKQNTNFQFLNQIWKFEAV